MCLPQPNPSTRLALAELWPSLKHKAPPAKAHSLAGLAQTSSSQAIPLNLGGRPKGQASVADSQGPLPLVCPSVRKFDATGSDPLTTKGL
ncbi:unnamed protein product [Parajaminaea phylloscopi]